MSSLNEARLQATAYKLAAQAIANRVRRIAQQSPSKIPGAVRALAQEETIEFYAVCIVLVLVCLAVSLAVNAVLSYELLTFDCEAHQGEEEL